jgi:tetratricopeptide (TPR) repeat protein
MIEQAFISGQLGRAIYSEGGQQFVIAADHVEEPRPCSGTDLAMFFRSGAEYFAPISPISRLEELANELEHNTQAYKALTLAISIFDPELSDIRGLLIEAAEELLADAFVSAFVRRRLRARPLPLGADIEGALTATKEAGAIATYDLLNAVRASQFSIGIALSAWSEGAPVFFSSEDEMIEAEKLLVESGAFDEIITGMVSRNIGAVDSAVLRYSLIPSISSQIPRVRHLLTAVRNKARERLNLTGGERKETEKPEHKRESDSIRDLLSRFDDNEKRIRKRFSGSEAKARVDAQIDPIKGLIAKHDINLATKWVRDLVEFQVGHGEKRHLGMTLCSLAACALDAGETDFATALIEHAEALGIEDPVIFGSKAWALKAAGDLLGALVEFDSAIRRFPDDPWLRNGRAEVLKAMGHFDEALKQYDETAQRFPDDAVARNGRAEVLKAMGRFDEALGQYDETAQRFPDDAVVRNGRAEVLKAMGRFDEALTQYDETVQRFPDNAVVRNGRAEVLKAMGRFDEALMQYDETVRRFPDDVVVRTGRAEVLKAMGRFDEALGQYDETIQRFPDNAVARAGRAEVLKAMGRFDEALGQYRESRQLFPYDRRMLRAEASVLLAMNRIMEARDLLLPETNPVSPDDWVKFHLLAMMYLKSGNLDAAITRLSNGAERGPWQSRSFFVGSLAVARIRKEEFERALPLLEAGMGLLDVVQKQRRLVLIGHSHAAIGEKQTAVASLKSIGDMVEPNIGGLRSLLVDRYELGGHSYPKTHAERFPFLDVQIAQKEFLLAIA